MQSQGCPYPGELRAGQAAQVTVQARQRGSVRGAVFVNKHAFAAWAVGEIDIGVLRDVACVAVADLQVACVAAAPVYELVATLDAGRESGTHAGGERLLALFGAQHDFPFDDKNQLVLMRVPVAHRGLFVWRQRCQVPATLSPRPGTTPVLLPPLQHSGDHLHRLRSRPAVLQLGLSAAAACPAGAPGGTTLPATRPRTPLARSPPARLPGTPQGPGRPPAATPALHTQPLGTDPSGLVQHRALLLLLWAQELPVAAADFSASTPAASRKAPTGNPSRPNSGVSCGRLSVRAPRRSLLHPALCQTCWTCSPESVRYRATFTVEPAHWRLLGTGLSAHARVFHRIPALGRARRHPVQ